MRFGFVQPFGTAADIVEAAVLAEQSGWDALFVAETVWGVDAWVALSAAAMRTSRIRLGTMLTPLPRHKPWDVASKVVTLDHLSGGRAQLTVGLGALHEGWLAFEPETTQAERAALLDEGLAVYDGLMRGQPFTFDGEYYRVRPTDFFLPDPPVQRPRVPVWVVGAYRSDRPGRRSLRRASRWDGLLPQVIEPNGDFGPSTPEQLAGVVAEVRALREDAGLTWDGFDVIMEGTTPAEDPGAAASQVRGWAAAGATWWVESDWEVPGSAHERRSFLHRRITAGPPPS